MAWYELTLRELCRIQLDMASARLFALGAQGLQEDQPAHRRTPPQQPWDTGPPPPEPDKLWLRAWFEDPDQISIMAQVHDLGCEAVWSSVEEQNWETSWQAQFPVLEISPRLIIAPPWDPREGALILEPGQGFGTGHHPTTRGALRLIDRYACTNQTLLDVGCGSGILALAACQLGMHAQGVDISEDAIRNAQHNARLNGLDVRFSTQPIHQLAAPLDLVAANLFAERIVELADDLVRLTGQHLILAGILLAREQLVEPALSPLTLIERHVEGEWVHQVYRR